MPMPNVPLAYTVGSAAPTVGIPADACDCHLHVYDGRFDGLTLLGTSIGPQAIAPHLVKLPYDAVEAFAPVSAALPHVQSGRLRVLATTSSARLPALPTEPQAPDIIW
ncbi:hypothetical protein EV686_101445 [Paracandidimonas soli]|uniref:Amidohydrolase family protein n=1 Tax=Paracandidimonas soli TaxID=1917182 RepID=A0A4R3VG33_9BURK|nr:hypothetical protein EV686_101445 [Paracandidimonas soli]